MLSLALTSYTHHGLLTPPSNKPPLLEELASIHFTPLSTQSNSLPQAYIWPVHDKPSLLEDHTRPSASIDIPIIDMADEPCAMTSKLAYACEHWGVFYVSNHGVPLDLLKKVMEKSMNLFSLPLSTKLRALRQEESFEGFGKAMIGKFFDSLLWSEGFTMMGYPSKSSIAKTTGKLCQDGHNDFRDAYMEYEKAMRMLGCRLMQAILEGLGTDMEEFAKKHYDVERDGSTALQLNYYPPCAEPEMAMGMPAHTDSTCLTILQQGEVGGLEMRGSDGSWKLVPPLDTASLVVHVGDLLQVLSNGRYKSIVHRATLNKERPRLSIVCLCFPPTSATIAPLQEARNYLQSQELLYRPMRWKDYIQAKSEHFMKALDHFKNDNQHSPC